MAETSNRRAQFADYVRLHGIGRGLIGRADEREILKEGVGQFGLSLDDAREVIASISSRDNLPIQRVEEDRLRGILRRQAEESRGYISMDQFQQAAQTLREFTGRSLSSADADSAVKRIMLEENWQPRRSSRFFGSRRWFQRIPV